jgi:hypothetical protein
MSMIVGTGDRHTKTEATGARTPHSDTNPKELDEKDAAAMVCVRVSFGVAAPNRFSLCTQLQQLQLRQQRTAPRELESGPQAVTTTIRQAANCNDLLQNTNSIYVTSPTCRTFFEVPTTNHACGFGAYPSQRSKGSVVVCDHLCTSLRTIYKPRQLDHQT